MRIDDQGSQLTYCVNVHPTQSWAELRAALEGPARAVKEQVSPSAPFAIGMRVSAETLEELGDQATRDALRGLLEEHDLHAVTMNGFPFGPFHGEAVKRAVYEPDWRRPERLDYTLGLGRLMTEIAPPQAPEDAPLSISTVPAAFQIEDPVQAEAAALTAAEGLLRAAAGLLAIGREAGREIALAIEPEPCCLIETTDQAIRFFEDHLLRRAPLNQFALLADLSRAEAETALRRHLGLCYDVCHQAVEFEDPAESLGVLRDAGIEIVKLQLSAALRCHEMDGEVREALRPFAEPTYLHQTIRRARDGALTRHEDLPEALALGAASDGEEWRIHFHVPVFLDAIDPFESTQETLREVLALHKAAPLSRHLEVETYTWEVLPEALRAPSIEESVARELLWVKEQLA